MSHSHISPHGRDNGVGAALSRAQLQRYGVYPWWIRAFWEMRFFFPQWRLPAQYPRGPIAGGRADADDLRLVFGGDFMVKTGDQPVAFDPQLVELLAKADMFFAPLEAPVVGRPPDREIRYPRGLRMPPFALPVEQLIEQCRIAGLEPERVCLSVAANHAGDLGAEAFDEGCALLAAKGFRTVGRWSSQGGLVDVVDVAGLRVAVLAWTRWMNQDPFSWQAPGVNRQFHLDRADLKACLAQSKAQLAIALPHWGLEMRSEPLRANRDLARRLAHCGFGLIVGSHPHMLQPVALSSGGLCAFSLGNFTYTLSNIASIGQSWRSCLSGLLEVRVKRRTGAISAYRLIPVVEWIDDQGCRLSRLGDYRGQHKEKYRLMIDNLFVDSASAALA